MRTGDADNHEAALPGALATLSTERTGDAGAQDFTGPFLSQNDYRDLMGPDHEEAAVCWAIATGVAMGQPLAPETLRQAGARPGQDLDDRQTLALLTRLGLQVNRVEILEPKRAVNRWLLSDKDGGRRRGPEFEPLDWRDTTLRRQPNHEVLTSATEACAQATINQQTDPVCVNALTNTWSFAGVQFGGTQSTYLIRFHDAACTDVFDIRRVEDGNVSNSLQFQQITTVRGGHTRLPFDIPGNQIANLWRQMERAWSQRDGGAAHLTPCVSWHDLNASRPPAHIVADVLYACEQQMGEEAPGDVVDEERHIAQFTVDVGGGPSTWLIRFTDRTYSTVAAHCGVNCVPTPTDLATVLAQMRVQ